MNESPICSPFQRPISPQQIFFFEALKVPSESVVSRSSLLGSVLDRLRLLQCLPFHLIPRGSRFQITALLLGIFWVRGSQKNPSARGFLAFWWFCLPKEVRGATFSLGKFLPQVHRYHPDLCVPESFWSVYFQSKRTASHVMVESSVWRCHDAANSPRRRENISALP